jgi:iron complex outermembrane receptor protein
MSCRPLTALLVATTALSLPLAAPAAAQTPSRQVAQAGTMLEEIVVTARRREENLQSVPIAITAFTPEALQKNDIRNVADLEQAVPGLALCCQNNAVQFGWLRGVPGVLGYFGEVNTPLNGSALYFDLGNVQVLKGPQGTLFGVSTNGGAILYQPKRPVNNVEGYVQATLGDYGRRQLEGVLNIPVVDDKFLLRVGATTTKVDGFIHDPVQNKDLADEDYWVARVSATAKLTDRLENYFVINYYKTHTNNIPLGVLAEVNPAGPARFVFANLDALLAQQRALGFYTIPGTSTAGGTFYRNTQWNIVDNLTYELTDDLTLKNIFGYVGSKTFARNDLDALPVPILDTQVQGSTKMPIAPEYTEELQLQGKLFDKLTLTVGAFNRWAKNTPTTGGILYLNVFGNVFGTLTKAKARTHALYAQGTYDLDRLLPGLSFTGGIRYSWDHRSQDVTNLVPPGINIGRTQNSASWRSPSYTLGVNYQATPDVMLFVTNSKGYSSGGFNPTAPAIYQKFDPETLNNIEAGIKADWNILGMRARTNISGFYGFYDNIQVSVTQTVQTPAGPTIAVVTQNAATGHIKGLEVEATLIPFDALEVSGNLSLVKAKYDRYISNGVDVSGTPFIQTPNRKFGVRGTFHVPVDAAVGAVSITADYTHQYRLLSTSRLQPTPFDYGPGVTNLNVSIDWNDIMGRQGLDAQLFAHNVTKNHWYHGTLGTYDTLGVLGIGVAPPRMWGVRLRYSFE